MRRSYYLIVIITLFFIFQSSLAADFNVVAPEAIHTLEIDTPVQVTGIVTVEPGILGLQFFYINGAQIYSYYKDFPDVHIGDKITVKGVISQSRGEKRVKTKTSDDIDIIYPNYKDPIPRLIRINEIDNSLIGQLVTVKGRVVERTGQRIFIDEEGLEEAVLYIKKYTDIDTSRISQGDKIEATGMVSRLDEELRILPRSNNDIVYLAPEISRVEQAESDQEILEKIAASAGSPSPVIDFNAIAPYVILISLILGGIFIIVKKAG